MMIGKKRNFVISFMFVILLFVVASCATVGREFSVDAVTQIRLGETTKEDISKMLGHPWRIGLDDGNRTWTYGYYKYKLFGETTTRDLVIKFDSNGVVSSYTFNTSDIGKNLH